MKGKILLIGLCILMLTGSGCCIDGRFTFAPVNYGWGWVPWACIMEEGGSFSFNTHPSHVPDTWSAWYKAGFTEPRQIYSCFGSLKCNTSIRDCPFEYSSQWGWYQCSPESIRWPSFPDHLFIDVIIPEDIKLVTSDNYVVENTLCVGDKFRLVRGRDIGEWIVRGGDIDTPPIYWVDDVEKLFLDMMAYHDSTFTRSEDIHKELYCPDGYVDPVFNIPVYSISTPGLSDIFANIHIGSIVCSVKEKEIDVPSSLKKSGDYYEATDSGDTTFNAEFVVECMDYYFAGAWSNYLRDCIQLRDMSKCDLYLFRVPTIIKNGPEDRIDVEIARGSCSAPVHMYRSYNSIEDFFRVGVMNFTREIRIEKRVDPPSISISSFIGSVVFGETSTVRLLIRNEGEVDITIKDITCNVDYEFLACDKPSLKPNEEAECLLSVVPKPDSGISASVKYEYESCGRSIELSGDETIVDLVKIQPHRSAQVSRMDVHGDCTNTYYACYTPDKDGKLSVGYNCFNRDLYFIPGNERFDLGFDISSLPENVDILSAKVYLNAINVNKPQDVMIYGIDNEWIPKACTPGGDICGPTYCKDECSSLYDIGANVISKIHIDSSGWYSFDVTEFMRSEYGNGKGYLSFQFRGNTENMWNERGRDSCTKSKDWDHYDVEFSGVGGADRPYLQVIYSD